jgi:hypothetical protein
MIEFKPRFFVLPCCTVRLMVAVRPPNVERLCRSPMRASLQASRRSSSPSLLPPRGNARSLATTSPDLGQISDNKREGQSDAFHGRLPTAGRWERPSASATLRLMRIHILQHLTS